MQVDTFERAIHLWPEWHKSIEESRKALGYDPRWAVDRAVDWIESHYVSRIRPRGVTELKRMDLPPKLLEYWEDCFYCDYRREDGTSDLTKIRRALALGEVDRDGKATGRWLPGARSRPPLPFDVSFVGYPGEEQDDPWVRLEFMVFAPLASRDLLKTAADQAWETLRLVAFRPGPLGRRPHPLTELVPQAKSKRSERKRAAIERYRRGDANFDDLLVDEWLAPAVQRKLRRIESGRHGSSSTEKRRARSRLEKQVYDRVWNWLPEPKPKSTRRWRSRLRS